MEPAFSTPNTTIDSRRQRWRSILQIAWPLIIANSFWNLQLTIDRVFLGNFSTEALGAAMAVMGLFWTPMALLQQTAAYVTTFVAQYYGAKRLDRIGPSVWQSIYVSIAGGLLFLLLIPLRVLSSISSGIRKPCRSSKPSISWRSVTPACPPRWWRRPAGFSRVLATRRSSCASTWWGLIANAVFDYVLIFGKFGFPAMGVAGAGYATALGTWASAFMGCTGVSEKHERVQGAFGLAV